MNPEKQINLNINVKELPELKCKDCNGIAFSPMLVVKRISPFVSPTGHEQLIFHQIGLICCNCGFMLYDLQAMEQVLSAPMLEQINSAIEQNTD